MTAGYLFRNAFEHQPNAMTELIHDSRHDPGTVAAIARATVESSALPIRVRDAELRVGTAGWTDRTLTARGVFYPEGTSTPEARLRYYASRFSMVEADVGFYAIPDRAMTERWVERTPDDFVFDVKAHALMTGHATDVARLPRVIRDELPSSLASGRRVYAKDLPPELRDEVWRLFRDAVVPLHEAGKLGAILLQFAPWIRPARHTPAMLARVRERLGDLPIGVEFRHPSWLEPRLRERVWSQLREQRMTYVIADTPPGTDISLPRVAAITTPDLSVVRLHGRRSELWGVRDAQVVEKYRYLYDREELEDWLGVILELSEQTERLHIVFNNCYANYGTTNALEMTGMLLDSQRQ
jgi:uncharacterized protein YecE (DUF72 family)